MEAMPTIAITNDMIRVGPRFAVTFHRTLVIPDDGQSYPLPPGLGTFPIFSVSEYRDRVPPAWRQGTAFIPMHRSEALWIGFHGAIWKPNAVQVSVGRVNAITGEIADGTLRNDPQNYLVTPSQPWLDGINTGAGIIRQFRAVPIGSGDSIEAGITGEERHGGIQLDVFEPHPGIFPDTPPANNPTGPMRSAGFGQRAPDMSLGAGGQMHQRLYPDPYEFTIWDGGTRGTIVIFLSSPETFRTITGHDAPPSPIDAQTYTDLGLPWFDLSDAKRSDLPGSDRLKQIPSIGQGEESIAIPEDQLRRIEPETPGPIRQRDDS